MMQNGLTTFPAPRVYLYCHAVDMRRSYSNVKLACMWMLQYNFVDQRANDSFLVRVIHSTIMPDRLDFRSGSLPLLKQLRINRRWGWLE